MLRIIYDRYSIDEKGNIFDNKKNRFLKHFDNGFGYKYVMLTMNGVYRQYKVHRLVAETFLPNLYDKPFINHKDCNRSNNHLNNLEWCTQKENINYAQKVNSVFNERNKRVNQYDKNNNLINTYESISEASRQTNILIASISYSANGKRKTGGGFVWDFA